jgi:hypothetical protein
MDKNTEGFAGFDVAKARHAVAIAEGGRQGDVRYGGEVDADPEACGV